MMSVGAMSFRPAGKWLRELDNRCKIQTIHKLKVHRVLRAFTAFHAGHSALAPAPC